MARTDGRLSGLALRSPTVRTRGASTAPYIAPNAGGRWHSIRETRVLPIAPGEHGHFFQRGPGASQTRRRSTSAPLGGFSNA